MGHNKTHSYKAFISYSRSDETLVVDWMRRLERFRIPAHLVGRKTAGLGPVPKTLRPIFRDREEFAASHSLQGAIEDALRASEYLLVFCSPASANSRWVNEEVELFRRLNGDRKIITIIVDGEIDAPVGELQDGCLPPALTAPSADGVPADVPLGADVRDNGDGVEIALYKVIAGMIGVPLGELQQRHEKRARRIRRNIALLAASIGIALVYLAYTATMAERDAIAQRAEAEQLIEFMLGDLREGLVPIGRTELLASVGNRALAYYAKQDLRTLSSESLGRRARAFHLLGETLRNSQKHAEAATYFDLAFESTKALYERKPTDYQVVFDHAQSAFWYGDIGINLGDFDRLLRGYSDYYQLTKILYDLRPNDPGAIQEWIWGNSNLGSFYVRYRPNAQRAKPYLDVAYTLLQQQNARLPSRRNTIKALATNRQWAADMALLDYNWQQAITYRQQSNDWLAGWQPQKRDWDLFAMRIWNKYNIATLHSRLGNYPKAQAIMPEILSQSKERVSWDKGGIGTIEGYERAARLQYLLWATERNGQSGRLQEEAFQDIMASILDSESYAREDKYPGSTPIVSLYQHLNSNADCSALITRPEDLSWLIDKLPTSEELGRGIFGKIYYTNIGFILSDMVNRHAEKHDCDRPADVQAFFDRTTQYNNLNKFAIYDHLLKVANVP